MLNQLKQAQNVKELTDSEKLNIKGGTGTCAYFKPSGRISTVSNGWTLSGDCPCVHRGVSKSEALAAISGVEGARWCCDSCDQATWLQ